jgi:nucleoid DNA-binding protein
MKVKPKILVWRNKHLARDIARSCDIPYEEAVKLLQVIINILQVKLKSERVLTIRKFGKFKYSKLARPKNRAAYRTIRFTASRQLNAILGNIPTRDNYEYEIKQARKIRRLLLAGDKSRAKELYDRLIIRLDNNLPAKQFLLDRSYYPIKFKDSNKIKK